MNWVLTTLCCVHTSGHTVPPSTQGLELSLGPALSWPLCDGPVFTKLEEQL